MNEQAREWLSRERKRERLLRLQAHAVLISRHRRRSV